MAKPSKRSFRSARSAKAKSTKNKSSKVKPSKAKATTTSRPANSDSATSPKGSSPDPLNSASKAGQTMKCDANARPSKRARLFDASSRTITLLVGEQEVSFFIHEGILCENCPVFASACKPAWMRDDDPKIELPEDDHELIEVLVYWMYRRILFFPSSFEKDHVDITSSLSSAPGLLARLFILAEKYQITPLQNDIIDAFIIWLDNYSLQHRIPASVIQYVWEHTISEGCMLRLCLIDYVRAEYTYWNLKTAREVIVDEDFWYELSRESALTVDLLRECLDEDGPELIGDMREHLEDDLTIDVCVNWHTHGAKEEQCRALKRYVLDSEEEKDG